ncbi:MAG: hypothetical protein KGL39_49760 [Patescibacteria group bacterium]|nr:hypothetical protein [Patescibacteria group bacterium]
MKPISVAEKKALLQFHGERLEQAFQGLYTNRKSELLKHAQRYIEVLKTIPKDEFAPE